MPGSSRTVENAAIFDSADKLTNENATSNGQKILAAIKEAHPNVVDMSDVDVR